MPPACVFGLGLGRPHRGNGYATEAVWAMVAALHRVGVRSVGVGTAVTNRPVLRIVEKLGARCNGQSLHTLPNGSVVDSLWYSFESDAGAARL